MIAFAGWTQARLQHPPETASQTSAGTDQSPRTSPCLSGASDVTLDNPGNVYIADPGNHRVRWINVSTGQINTIAGKTTQTSCATDDDPALSLCLGTPRHVSVSPNNARLYISDEAGNRIWRVNLVDNTVRRVAGSATGAANLCADDTDARASTGCLDQPEGIAVQRVGGVDRYLFIAETGNGGRVLRLDLTEDPERVRTVYSDGEVSTDVAVGPDGSVYIAQPNAHRILRLTTGSDSDVDGQSFDGSESTETIAGNGSSGVPIDGTVATSAALSAPKGVAADADGHVLIADAGNHTLYVVESGVIYRIGGSASGQPGYCGDPDPELHNARDGCLSGPSELFYHDLGSAAQRQYATLLRRRRKQPNPKDALGLRRGRPDGSG